MWGGWTRAVASGRMGGQFAAESQSTRLTLGYRLRASHPPPQMGGVVWPRRARTFRFNFQTACEAVEPTLRRPATLFSGARAGPYPVSFSLFRGDGAPGGARELARLPSPACEAGVSRQDSGTLSFPRGWGSRGARALLRKGPAPPGAPSRCRCRTPHPAPPSNAAIDGALD